MSDYTNPQFWPVLKQLAVNIDGMDYYQILNLAQDATPAQIKKSFYDQSRALHPDRFHTLPDEELKKAIHKIFKRITEAYNILHEDKKRRVYTQNINGPNRAHLLRYNENAEAEQKQQEKQEKEVCTTPKARALYIQAVAKMKTYQWDAAFKDLTMAMMFEPNNQKLKQLKDEVDAKRPKPKPAAS